MNNFRKKLILLFVSAAVFGFISVGFSNCGGGSFTEEYINEPGSSDASISGVLGTSGGNPLEAIDINDPRNLGADLCEKQIRSSFSAGYHQFFQSKCVNCHSNGPGRGRFANSNLELAFIDFTSMGYVTLSDKAKSNHQFPYTGPENAPAVNDLQTQWGQTLAEFNTCKGQATTPTPQPTRLEDRVSFRTDYKAIPVMNSGESRDVIFDLNAELRAIKTSAVKPSLPNAKLVVSVSRKLTSGGQSYYLVSRPRIKFSSTDVHVKGMFVYINFSFLNYPTTFTFIDTSIYKNLQDDVASLFSSGSLVAPGLFSTNDKIAIGFDMLEPVSLPPPPPPQSVEFVAPLAQLVPLNPVTQEIAVRLLRPAEQVVNVSISDIASTLCGQNISVTTANSVSVNTATVSTCYPEAKALLCPSNSSNCIDQLVLFRARSKVGSSYNRFDWDFTLENTSLVFFPGEQEKKFIIRFSKDIRREGTRILTLKMDVATPGVAIGSRKEISFVFNKLTNLEPPIGVATFAELMDPSTGILGSRCLACHNSTQRAGGYDMSDYELMVQRGILIPGSRNSEMFVRMNPGANQIDKQPMPLNGFLETYQVREVERWILNGALNN